MDREERIRMPTSDNKSQPYFKQHKFSPCPILHVLSKGLEGNFNLSDKFSPGRSFRKIFELWLNKSEVQQFHKFNAQANCIWNLKRPQNS
jgi:hypothetical protein